MVVQSLHFLFKHLTGIEALVYCKHIAPATGLYPETQVDLLDKKLLCSLHINIVNDERFIVEAFGQANCIAILSDCRCRAAMRSSTRASR